MHLDWELVKKISKFLLIFYLGILNISKEVSKDTCINIDTFAVTKISEALSSDDSARYEELLWYYFQEPGIKTMKYNEIYFYNLFLKVKGI